MKIETRVAWACIVLVVSCIVILAEWKASHTDKYHNVSKPESDVGVWTMKSWVPPAAPRNDTHYNKDDLNLAAMNRMWDKVDHLTEYSRYPKTTIDAARYKLKCFEDWVKTLQDEEVKEAYFFWIGFYESRYDRIEENSRKSKDKDIADPYEVEKKAKQARADALLIPKPPRALCLGTEKAQ